MKCSCCKKEYIEKPKNLKPWPGTNRFMFNCICNSTLIWQDSIEEINPEFINPDNIGEYQDEG